MNTMGDVVAKRGVHKGGKGKTDKRKKGSKAQALNPHRGKATRPITKKIRAAGVRQPHHKGILA